MQVKVLGKAVEVGVSEGGMFYDMETKTISATTIKGLQKKLLAARSANRPQTPVETHNGRKGVVTGRVTGTNSHWRRRYFTVKWSDGTVTEDSGSNLRRPLTDAERAELVRLGNVQSTTRAAWEKASSELSAYQSSFVIFNDLESLYPVG